MNKISIVFLLVLTTTFSITDVKAPKGYAEIVRTTGDLDKDKIPELVVVYNTSEEEDFGITREIQIFKNKNNKWNLWHKSRGAVLPSDHGGMMGDPFEGINITNGILEINHFGGSRWKWSYTHKYRYQKGDFYLIGATIGYGANPEGFTTVDYNLSTGQIDYSAETLIEDDKTNWDDPDTWNYESTDYSITRKIKTPIKMNGFYPGDNKVNLKNGDEFYF